MDRAFPAGGREYREGTPLVIAEIGTGHGGDPVKAAELIDAAAEAGADCAKFQCVFADEIIHPNTGTVPLPGGDIALFERFRELELGADFYRVLRERTESRGLLFLCTPFGIRSSRILRDIGVRAMKVASPELNHLPLLSEIAGYGLPVLLSCGVSTLADIERALGILAGLPLALLHCVTAYPAPPGDYNLRLIPGLTALLGLPVGVSDHSLDPILIPSLATALGAVAVEKHLCLSRADPGLDDLIALPPGEFRLMVEAIREASRRPADQTIDLLAASHGKSLVEASLGDGVKRLAPSEAANHGRTTRSIHALRDIEAGEALTEGNVALLRTEKLLRPGLEPGLLPLVIGRRARRRVPSGEGLTAEDLGDIA